MQMRHSLKSEEKERRKVRASLTDAVTATARETRERARASYSADLANGNARCAAIGR